MPKLTLYSREGCHLCEQMETALAALQQQLGFELEYLDIDERPELQALYGARIPVLCLGDEEICQHLLDEDRLLQALA